VNRRADIIAARATGVGVGLIAFMVTWLVGVRITERIWGPPSSAIVAMALAIVVGVVATVVAGRRFVHTVGPSEGPVVDSTAPATAGQES
jgi:hypothetical protein